MGKVHEFTQKDLQKPFSLMEPHLEGVTTRNYLRAPETPYDFIRMSEYRFGLPFKDVKKMDDRSLTKYLDYLDRLWDIS